MGRKNDAAELIRDLRPDGQPEKQTTTLTFSSGSYTTTLMKKAAVDSGRQPENPGEIDQFWFEEENMVVIDLEADE